MSTVSTTSIHTDRDDDFKIGICSGTTGKFGYLLFGVSCTLFAHHPTTLRRIASRLNELAEQLDAALQPTEDRIDETRPA